MTNATVESATKLADEFDKWQAELTSLLSELAHKDGADGARAEGLGQFLPTLRAAIAKMQLTPWFPAHIKPVRIGAYETDAMSGGVYQYWDGFRWSSYCNSPQSAFRFRASKSGYQSPCWRGLSQPTKD